MILQQRHAMSATKHRPVNRRHSVHANGMAYIVVTDGQAYAMAGHRLVHQSTMTCLLRQQWFMFLEACAFVLCMHG